MKWYNEPSQWKEADGTIEVISDKETDFWRKTHYGFIRDSGHFYYQETEGDFIAEVKITGQYEALYDQAGLMIRQDETTWLKCGIEYVDGVQQISAVVTKDFSDWSVAPLPSNPKSVWLRLTRTGSDIEIHYSLDSTKYELLRITHLDLSSTTYIGVMCASPDGPGFATTFENFEVDPKATEIEQTEVE